jgi:Flp pilus assembly protein TadD
MSLNRKSHRKSLWVAVASSAMFVLASCGTDEDTFVQKTRPQPGVAQSETPAPVPSTPQTAEPVAPPVREVTYEIAENAFLNARYGEAVDLFKRYTERESKNPWGYYMLGLSAWKDGRLDLAETAFEQSLTLDPDHLKSCINLSRVLLEDHRPSDALTLLDRALAVDSTSSAAHRLKGRAYDDLGRTEDAVTAYRTAVTLDPADAWSMNNLAFIRIQQGRYEEALPALARAVELRKDVPVFYNNLGMALEHGGHFSAAAEAYACAVSLDASNQKAALNHGRVAGVREDPSLPPVDLAALAREFESEVEAWRVSTTTGAKPDSVVSVQAR